MPATLTLPNGTRPSNLHLSAEMRHAYVDGDLYNICERIKEIDPRLYIVDLHKSDQFVYAIMEGECQDGFDHVIFKVRELDDRVLKRLRYLMALPLKVRLAIAEKEEHVFAEQAREAEMEELYERIGRPMWTDMDKCGFIPGGRGVSYPKSGHTGGKGSLRRN